MYAVIRMRGNVNVRKTIADTLTMLRLNRINHCVILDETPNNSGMIQKVKDYVAYGKIDAETLAQILANRGKIEGGISLTDEYIAENTDFDSIASFADAENLCAFTVSLTFNSPRPRILTPLNVLRMTRSFNNNSGVTSVPSS